MLGWCFACPSDRHTAWVRLIELPCRKDRDRARAGAGRRRSHNGEHFSHPPCLKQMSSLMVDDDSVGIHQSVSDQVRDGGRDYDPLYIQAFSGLHVPDYLILLVDESDDSTIDAVTWLKNLWGPQLSFGFGSDGLKQHPS